jgi:hypothetical protein
MNIEQIAKRYWEIYNSFDGQTKLIDLEIESIHMLAEELFYNGDMDEMKKTLVNMYYLGKINEEHNNKNK